MQLLHAGNCDHHPHHLQLSVGRLSLLQQHLWRVGVTTTPATLTTPGAITISASPTSLAGGSATTLTATITSFPSKATLGAWMSICTGITQIAGSGPNYNTSLSATYTEYTAGTADFYAVISSASGDQCLASSNYATSSSVAVTWSANPNPPGIVALPATQSGLVNTTESISLNPSNLPAGTTTWVYMTVSNGNATNTVISEQATPSSAFTVSLGTNSVDTANQYVADVYNSAGVVVATSNAFSAAWTTKVAYCEASPTQTPSQGGGSALTEGTPTTINAQYSGCAPSAGEDVVMETVYSAGNAAGNTIPLNGTNVLDNCPVTSGNVQCPGTFTPPAGPQVYSFETYLVSTVFGDVIISCSGVIVITWNNPSGISLSISPTTSQVVGSSFTMSSYISPPGYSYDVYICDSTTGAIVADAPGSVTSLSGSVSSATAQTDQLVAYLTNTANNAVCSGSTTGVTEQSNSVSATWTAATATGSIALSISPTSSQPVGSSFSLSTSVSPPSGDYDVYICDVTTGTMLSGVPGNVTSSAGSIASSTAETDQFAAYVTNVANNSVCGGSTTGVTLASNSVSATWTQPTTTTTTTQPPTTTTTTQPYYPPPTTTTTTQPPTTTTTTQPPTTTTTTQPPTTTTTTPFRYPT